MYIPIGPTGRMRISLRPASFVLRICMAISWPIYAPNSSRFSQATGRNAGFQNGCGCVTDSGGCETQSAIFSMSQPFGKTSAK